MQEIMTFVYIALEDRKGLISKHRENGEKAANWFFDSVTKILAKNGTLIRKEKDSLLAVYKSPLLGLTAIAEAGDSLLREKVLGHEILPFKAVINIGNATLLNSEYYGPGISHAEALLRIVPAKQIFMTGKTRTVLIDVIPGNITERSIGKAVIPDDFSVEEIFELVVAFNNKEQERSFLELAANNIAPQNEALFERKSELEELVKMGKDKKNRIIQIIGPAGCGKSRLACQAAYEISELCEDAFYMVDVSGKSERLLIYAAISEAMGIDNQSNMQYANTMLEQLSVLLSWRDVLVVIDEAEILNGREEILLELLKLCPKLRFIITAREALSLPASKIYNISNFSTVSDPGSKISKAASYFVNIMVKHSSLQLEEAKERYLVFAEMLEGNAKAIELFVANYSPLFEEALKGRQKAGASVLDFVAEWIYENCCGEKEKNICCFLSSVPAPLSLNALKALGQESVTEEDLKALCQKAICQKLERFSLPPVYIVNKIFKRVALERLSPVVVEESKKKFSNYLLEVVYSYKDHRVDVTALKHEKALNSEYFAVRYLLLGVELNCSFSEIEKAISALAIYWKIKFYFSESNELADILFARYPEKKDSKFYRRLLVVQARANLIAEDKEKTASLLKDATDLCEKQGDNAGLADIYVLRAWLKDGNTDAEGFIADSLKAGELFKANNSVLGVLEVVHANAFVSERLRDKNAYLDYLSVLKNTMKEHQEARYSGIYAKCIKYLIEYNYNHKEYLKANELIEEIRDISKISGEEAELAGILRGVGIAESDLGNYEKAVGLYKEAAVLYERIGYKTQWNGCTDGLCGLYFRTGNYRESLKYRLESFKRAYQVKDLFILSYYFLNIAELNCILGDYKKSAFVLGASLNIKAVLKNKSFFSDGIYQKLAVDLRGFLGEKNFAAFWSAGLSSSIKQTYEVIIGKRELAEVIS